jgi:predicted transcriptional regulator
MPEEKAEKQSAKQERTAWILRERLGKVSRRSIAHNQAHSHIGKQIVKALGKSSQTVPEIAEATGLPSDQILWCLMAMKKYGKLVEGQQRGDYYEYALNDKREKPR